MCVCVIGISTVMFIVFLCYDTLFIFTIRCNCALVLCYFDMSDGQKSAIEKEECCSQVSCFPKALSSMLCRTITTEYFVMINEGLNSELSFVRE